MCWEQQYNKKGNTDDLEEMGESIAGGKCLGRWMAFSIGVVKRQD